MMERREVQQVEPEYYWILATAIFGLASAIIMRGWGFWLFWGGLVGANAVLLYKNPLITRLIFKIAKWIGKEALQVLIVVSGFLLLFFVTVFFPILANIWIFDFYQGAKIICGVIITMLSLISLGIIGKGIGFFTSWENNKATWMELSILLLVVVVNILIYIQIHYYS